MSVKLDSKEATEGMLQEQFRPGMEKGATRASFHYEVSARDGEEQPGIPSQPRESDRKQTKQDHVSL